MAFHVACPITCRRICDCELGFPPGLRGAAARGVFLDEVAGVEEFIRDPWLSRPVSGGDTVEILVPKVASPLSAQQIPTIEDGASREELSHSVARRAVFQQKALAESVAAEDYVRRMEAGYVGEAQGEETIVKDDQGSSTVKVICRICFSGENGSSDRAIKMLSCKLCGKKYHRSCLKVWADYRDLFHWSSWACPSCRICEVCHRTGDPSKLMFCKRCDGAYHCYCLQPPHRNVSHGPLLCPKHTRCHSCGSTVPGNGPSTKWFLGYTMCDACGRLFTKRNYCPVCLKVYRDSEPTPMVCCDICQQWVHCECDGISDAKYQQFQADEKLQYTCAACRGASYQVKDTDDAVRELWKRRDKADHDLIASLRVAYGLPSQEDMFSLSPFSDVEENKTVVLKSDPGKSLKFSFKGSIDKSHDGSKEHAKGISMNSLSTKKTSKKECQINLLHKVQEPYQIVDTQQERARKINFGSEITGGAESYRIGEPVSPPLSRVQENDCFKSQILHPGSHNNHSSSKIEMPNNFHKTAKVKIKGSKPQTLLKSDGNKNTNKNEVAKGTKLVIHIGTKNKTSASSPKSEASGCYKEQDFAASNGSEDISKWRLKDTDYRKVGEDISKKRPKDAGNHMAHGGNAKHDALKGAKIEDGVYMRKWKIRDREGSLMKVGNVSDIHRSRVSLDDGCELLTSTRNPVVASKLTRNGSNEVETCADSSSLLKETSQQKQYTSKSSKFRTECSGSADMYAPSSVDEPKPLLKLKFKEPYFEQRSSWTSKGMEDKNPMKRHRSVRKRSTLIEKIGARENEGYAHTTLQSTIDDAIDANWILQKLGKDAIGKRVEVHQPSDSSWLGGVVSNVLEGSSSLLVSLDDGRSRVLELEKQRVRFVSQKQKKTRL